MSTFLNEILKYKSFGTVLDIGAGLGQNSFFLAKKGFEVEAIDFSEESIKQIKNRAKGLRMSVKKMDIKTTPIASTYDIILCSFVLHHFNQKERADFFRMIKDHTIPGGLNLVSVFVAKDGVFKKKNVNGSPLFLLKNNELNDIYFDWEILQFEQTKAKPLDPNKKPLVEFFETILARKK